MSKLSRSSLACYFTSMIMSGTVRSIFMAFLMAALVVEASSAASADDTPTTSDASVLVAQSGTSSPSLVPVEPDLATPTQGSSILSIAGGKRLMTEAGSAVTAQNYDLAVSKLQEARQVFNQLSNFYQDLAGSFSGIDNRIADDNRRKARDTAQMRDEATYQLALVHRAQNQPELAVPLLVQIVRSQQPTRDLGGRAYQQLLELGFVDSPFPTSGSTSQSPL